MIPILIMIVSFIFYYFTLAPSVIWGDSAKLSILSNKMYLDFMPGSHSLHNLIGYYWGLLPFNDYAYGQNMLSAVFSSITVGIIYIIVFKLTKSILSSIVSSLVITVSHTFWLFSVINESYSLLFLILCLTLLEAIIWNEKRYNIHIFMVFLLLALGICNHYLTTIFLPTFIIYFIIQNPKLLRNYLFYICVICGSLMGGSLLLYILFQKNKLPFIHVPLNTLLNEILDYQLKTFYVGPEKITSEIIMYPAYLFYQFPGIGILIGLHGFYRVFLFNKNIFILFFTIFLSIILFSLGYQYQRQFILLSISYIIFSIWIGIGFTYSINLIKLVFNIRYIHYCIVILLFVTPIFLYYSIPSILSIYNYSPINIRTIPYRDNIKFYYLPDKSQNYEALKYGSDIFNIVDKHSIIIGDFTVLMVLEYLQTFENMGRGVELKYVDSNSRTSKRIVQLIENGKNVYICDIDDYRGMYDIENLNLLYKFMNLGPIYKIEPLNSNVELN